jgi:hypothetical protein
LSAIHADFRQLPGDKALDKAQKNYKPEVTGNRGRAAMSRTSAAQGDDGPDGTTG